MGDEGYVYGGDDEESATRQGDYELGDKAFTAGGDGRIRVLHGVVTSDEMTRNTPRLVYSGNGVVVTAVVKANLTPAGLPPEDAVVAFVLANPGGIEAGSDIISGAPLVSSDAGEDGLGSFASSIGAAWPGVSELWVSLTDAGLNGICDPTVEWEEGMSWSIDSLLQRSRLLLVDGHLWRGDATADEDVAGDGGGSILTFGSIVHGGQTASVNDRFVFVKQGASVLAAIALVEVTAVDGSNHPTALSVIFSSGWHDADVAEESGSGSLTFTVTNASGPGTPDFDPSVNDYVADLDGAGFSPHVCDGVLSWHYAGPALSDGYSGEYHITVIEQA